MDVRSYGQYCGLAKALDVVGDRWSLLIIRELLIRPACRYTDLQRGLPGIATNLLADRLRELEQSGLIQREEAPPPVAATLFSLTVRGQELENAVRALGLWGAPLLAQTEPRDEFRAHWLLMLLTMLLQDRSPKGKAITVELRPGEESVVLEASGGQVTARMGPAEKPAAVLSGHPAVLLGVLTGKLNAAQAAAAGMRSEGDLRVLNRFVLTAQSRRFAK
jgi:DNA-binding HxlR family transcriptional regulator